MRKPGRYLLFEVQRVTETPGALGMTETPTTFFKLRGKSTRFSGAEVQKASALGKSLTHAFYFPRYRPGITDKDKLVCGSRTFNIIWVENIGERNSDMRMLVQEI